MTTERQPGSPGAVEEVPKDHFDTDGNPCTLDTLCRREPAWAANIIRTLRARVAELDAEHTETVAEFDEVNVELDGVKLELLKLREEHDEAQSELRALRCGLQVTEARRKASSNEADELLDSHVTLLKAARKLVEAIYGEACSDSREESVAESCDRAARHASELHALRARVAELEAEARMWSATAEENEAAIRHLVSIIDRDGGQLQQGDPPVSAAARAGCSVHVLHDRAESAEARVAALEKLFDDAGQGEHNVLALIDHYQSEAMAESERRREAEARVKELEESEAAHVRRMNEIIDKETKAIHKAWDEETDALEARITDLESQLAAAREGLQLVWSSRFAPADDADGRGMSYRVHGDVWERVRAILEVEAKGG